MSLDADVMIVGAGLTGAAIAAELTLRNIRVAVVDALQVGQGSTRLAPGLVIDDPQISATITGAHRLAELASRLRVPVRECDAADVIVVPADPSHLHVQHTRPGWMIEFSTLIAEILQSTGMPVLQQVEVQRIEADAQRVTLIAEGRTMTAGHVVLATGAYAGLLAPMLPKTHRVVRAAAWLSRPQTQPIRLNGLEAGLPLVVRGGRMMAIQDAAGRLRISSIQSADDAASEPVEEIQRFVRRYVHTLYDQTEHWHSGVTVHSVSGQPLVRAMQHEPRVIVALAPGPFAPAWVPLIADRVADQIFS